MLYQFVSPNPKPLFILLLPSRVPDLFEHPVSMGMPTKHASSPSGEFSCRGSLKVVAIPPERGMAKPLVGWLNLESLEDVCSFLAVHCTHTRLKEALTLTSIFLVLEALVSGSGWGSITEVDLVRLGSGFTHHYMLCYVCTTADTLR